MSQSEQSYLVEVRVISLLDDESEHDEKDLDLPESVEVKVDGDVKPEWIGNAALDAFHDSFAVEVLDDFRFEVWMNGEEMTEDTSDTAPESYSLKDKAKVV